MQINSDEPLFTLHGPNGQLWELKLNGDATGFPEGTVVINHAEVLLGALHGATSTSPRLPAEAAALGAALDSSSLEQADPS
jgi:hypothetical protein